jgi:hypothetical protein
MAARWLQRWLDETAGATIDEAVMVAGCLAALGGQNHDEALRVLRESGRKLDQLGIAAAAVRPDNVSTVADKSL